MSTTGKGNWVSEFGQHRGQFPDSLEPERDYARSLGPPGQMLCELDLGLTLLSYPRLTVAMEDDG